ncbi:MAG: glycine--tRNA ligase subunit beta, partial [Robiginitomaculum sp.]|nr:glycine--tRNA ligase subunit beta [Robiginitomaculum sp.]
DKEFLDLPPEVITLSMAKHQKYFSVNDAKTGKLAPHFLVVANLDAPDNGAAIVQGNQRVLTARLADARHFWDTDREQSLDSRIDALRDVVFHQKLGSVYDKAKRVAALAEQLAPLVGADPKLAKRAAMLAKADLTTQMVVEFTSLQGVMGRYYALADGSPPPSLRDTSPIKGGGQEKDQQNGSSSTKEGGQERGQQDDLSSTLVGEVAAQQTEGGLSSYTAAETAQIADAIADHYRPQGPTDKVPTDPVSITVALADKLDTLVGFWAIDEKPTGSKDPYALRRAALGVIRIVLENGVRLELWEVIQIIADFLLNQITTISVHGEDDRGIKVELVAYQNTLVAAYLFLENEIPRNYNESWYFWRNYFWPKVRKDLISFIHDRLKVHLRDSGIRHDVIDAVLTPDADDLVAIVARVNALSEFLDTEAGTQLLAGTKRAANIVKAEQKKTKHVIDGEVDESLFKEPAEKALYGALQIASKQAAKAITDEDYIAAMAALAPLREPIDEFFDAVMVNDDDPAIRNNRLRLLSGIGGALAPVANFDKIAG